MVRLRVDGGVEGASLHHDPVVDAQQGQAVRADEAQELWVETCWCEMDVYKGFLVS